MYKCLDCGETFKEPHIRTIHERHSEIDPPNIETYTEQLCPYCHSDYVLDGWACERCEGFTEFDYCEDCLQELDWFLERYVIQGMQVDRKMLCDMLTEWIERNE